MQIAVGCFDLAALGVGQGATVKCGDELRIDRCGTRKLRPRAAKIPTCHKQLALKEGAKRILRRCGSKPVSNTSCGSCVALAQKRRDKGARDFWPCGILCI